MRRPLHRLALTAACLIAVLVPGRAAVAADSADELIGNTYSGTATISVDAYDYCNGYQRTGSTSYELPVEIGLEQPATDGVSTESNPFNLAINAGSAANSGSVSFLSAASAGAPSGSVLLTYWNLSADGSNVSGELVDSHKAEAATLNLFNWEKPLVDCQPQFGAIPGGFPHEVAPGATLAGTLDESSADLTLNGATGDGLFAFAITISATR